MPDPITGMIISGVISGGLAIFGASKKAEAADKATNAQVEATDRATEAQTKAHEENIAFQKEIAEAQKAELKPWQDAGLKAQETIQTKIDSGAFDLSKYGYDDLIQDPGYLFRVQQGTNALETAAAARGKLISGDQLKDVVAYNNNMAGQEFNNAYARTASQRDFNYNVLADEADRGFAASAALSGVSSELGSRVGSSIRERGNVLAEGEYRRGDAIASGAINQGNVWGKLSSDLAKVSNKWIENDVFYNRLNKEA